MRQIPAPYWTEAHGPVFAYATRDDVHACCVTWLDEYVVLGHDDLRPLPRGAVMHGAEEVWDLADAVLDAMAPHVLDGGGVKPPRPRRFAVGEAVFGGHLFCGAVHAVGEKVGQGWGRPPRTASRG